MFSFLKKKSPYAVAAKTAYARILLQSREPVFYGYYGVPDSFDGRFDLLLLHIFMLLSRMKTEGQGGVDFNQALFDATFADMDQTLRERGIDDMGVPKHMRRMMKAFNGRMHSYEAAAAEGDGALAIALRRNLYGTLEDADVPDTREMVKYMKESIALLNSMEMERLLKGEAAFPLPAQKERKNVA